MILYNFCELVTSNAVVKTSKNTKHVYKINFAIAVNICRAYLKHGGNETESMLLIQKYLTPVRYNQKYPIPLRPKRNRDFMYRVAQISLPLYCIMRQICNLSFCHTQKMIWTHHTPAFYALVHLKNTAFLNWTVFSMHERIWYTVFIIKNLI